jgi:hypothetical protein
MPKRMSQESYEKRVQARSDKSARILNTPYPAETVNSIDWNAEEYKIIPNDPRWIMPPTVDIGADEWYQNLPQEEQIKIGMYRVAQIVKVGAQFEMALNMGIFSSNMNLKKNPIDIRYSHHEALEESEHIMMFLELLKQMEPELNRLGIDNVAGGPEWFINVAPMVTLVSRKLPLGFWSLVLSGEEPIDRLQRSLKDYDDNLEAQGITEGRIHPLVKKVMDVHIMEEAGHIGYANNYLGKRLEISSEDKEAGKDTVGAVNRSALALGTAALYNVFAKIIVVPSKQSQKDMGIPKEVAKRVWFESEYGQEAFHSFFKNALRRMDKDGLRDGEVKNRVGQAACRLFGLAPTEKTKNK